MQSRQHNERTNELGADQYNLGDAFGHVAIEVDDQGRRISNKQLAEVNLVRNDYHGEWNYKVAPNIS